MSLTSTDQGERPKSATAARIYDYILGGSHNFPADREAAKQLIRAAPLAPAIALASRAFLRRAIRFLGEAGVRQFLDLGSGVPTRGSQHEVTAAIPDATVIYVDTDPVAVAASLELFQDNPRATAVRADLREPESILGHSEVNRLIDFRQPVGVLLVATLHFMTDDAIAYPAVERLVNALPPGGYLVMSHACLPDEIGLEPGDAAAVQDLYQTRTATPVGPRSRAGVERFLTGLELVEPGLVWTPLWRPGSDDPTDFAGRAAECSVLVAVGRRT